MHDEFDVVHVNTSSGDIGGDQRLHLAALEVFECAVACLLGASAVQRTSGNAGIHQRRGDVVHAEAGLHEHHGGAVGLQQFDSFVDAAHCWRDDEAVLDVAVVDLVDQVVHRRIFEVLVDQFVDVAVERCRPQHGLAAGGRHVQDLAHIGHEAQVGHAVGLVDDADLDAAEIAVTLVDDVQQATGCGHDDRGALLQRMDLRRHRRATVDGLHEAPCGAAQRHEGALHLFGQLAGGHQHQPGGAVGGGLADSGHQRNAEAQCLARTRGCTAAQVSPGEGIGQRDRLHGEGFGHPAGGEGFGHPRGHAQFGKCGHVVVSLGVRCRFGNGVGTFATIAPNTGTLDQGATRVICS